MDITPFIDRLRGGSLTGDPNIYGLAEFDEQRMRAEPGITIWVLPESESSRDDTKVANTIERYTIVIALRDVSDPHGEKAVSKLLPLREEIKALLRSPWNPGDCRGIVRFADGVGQGFDENYTFWWIDNYEFERTTRLT